MWTAVASGSQEGEDGRGSGQGFGVGGLGFKGSTTENWLCDLEQVTQALWTHFLICEEDNGL